MSKKLKVLLINGSPHKNGCTHTALEEVASQLRAEGVETTELYIGSSPIHPCIACMKCAETGYCVFTTDKVNEAVDLLADADGVVIGSPVFYAGPNGSLCAFLDRLFFLKSGKYKYKPGAAVVSCRRGGASASFDRLNKYFTISNMPVVSSQYWNAVHGMTPADVKRDAEGLQIMRTLGRNMAWLMKCIAVGMDNGVTYPETEERLGTNFIREDLYRHE